MNSALEIPKQPVEIYQFRLWIKNISPMIWRRLLIRDDQTIADFHECVQIIMGWSNYYLHQFRIQGKAYGISYIGGIGFSDNARKVSLKQFNFRLNEKFIYEYNFFVNWECEIRLEKRLSLNPKNIYPRCTDGKRAAPPEDCGGSDAFMELADYYSPWKIKEKLIRLVKQRLMETKENKEEVTDMKYEYEEDDDEDYDDEIAMEETLETLQYWINRHRLDRRLVNQRLRKYFHPKNHVKPTLEEILP